jgi:hypothetical protein
MPFNPVKPQSLASAALDLNIAIIIWPVIDKASTYGRKGAA